MFLSVQAAVSVRGSCGGRWAMERESAEGLRRPQPAVCRGERGRAGERTGQEGAGHSVAWAAPSEGPSE